MFITWQDFGNKKVSLLFPAG